MRRLKRILGILPLAVIGTAVLASGAEAKKRSVRGVGVSEKWSVGQGTYGGMPIITRFDLGLKPLVVDPAYPSQLGIAVPFKQHTANGLPTPGETKELDTIEDEIAKRFSVGDESLFAGVVSPNNVREFILYTSDPKLRRQRLRSCRRKPRRTPFSSRFTEIRLGRTSRTSLPNERHA